MILSLKGSSGVSLPVVFGILATRLVLLPIIGIFIVKGVLYLSFVHTNPLYVYKQVGLKLNYKAQTRIFVEFQLFIYISYIDDLRFKG
uniref:Uncharacterized protein n=1 Tax=Lactuca sativa TaxID=4236 RepID=A0A9R1UMT1_LACSA|nr:hypothetical protein LSAT_V11C800407160 [Lactuca sativa]